MGTLCIFDFDMKSAAGFEYLAISENIFTNINYFFSNFISNWQINIKGNNEEYFLNP